MYYSSVVIILFGKGLYKPAFSTYSFGKTRFSSSCVLVFRVFVSLAFNFQFCFMFWIEFLHKRLNKGNISGNIIIYHMLFNFVLTLFKRTVKTWLATMVKIWELRHRNMLPERFWVKNVIYKKKIICKKNLELLEK